MFANIFTAASIWLLLAGIVMHGLAMFDKQRLEKNAAAAQRQWAAALYWVCWIALAILAVFLVVR